MNIDLKDICFSYKSNVEIPVFEGLSCSFGGGEIVGIVGKTGSGKSTLIQLCSGFLNPHSGRIHINGSEIVQQKDWNKFRKKIGIVFQFPEKQLFEETVFDDVAFGLKRSNISRFEMKQKVYESLERMGLDGDLYAERSPLQLSSGEKRKVAIAGIMAQDPEILFLDEPTIGLDKKSIDDMETMLSGLYLQGKTICIVSHNMDFLVRIAKRFIIIGDRRIQYDGGSEGLFFDGKGEYDEYVHKPEIISLCDEISKQSGADLSGIFCFEDLIPAFKVQYGVNAAQEKN